MTKTTYAIRPNPAQAGDYEFYTTGTPRNWPWGLYTGNPSPAQMVSIGYMPVIYRDYNPDTHRTTGAHTDDGEEVYLVTVALTPEELAKRLADQRAATLETVKNIRQMYLDLIAKSAGITQAYGMNGRATDLILSGQGATVLFATRTAEIYGANAGANMPQNFTALQWASYIDGERNREFSRGERIESDGYLHYLTQTYMAATIGELQALPGDYKTFCKNLMLGANIAEIEAVVRPQSEPLDE
jgi:hypothetical protein